MPASPRKPPHHVPASRGIEAEPEPPAAGKARGAAAVAASNGHGQAGAVAIAAKQATNHAAAPGGLARTTTPDGDRHGDEAIAGRAVLVPAATDADMGSPSGVPDPGQRRRAFGASAARPQGSLPPPRTKRGPVGVSLADGNRPSGSARATPLGGSSRGPRRG